MSAPSVLESPGSYDYFTLDGERSPGVAEIVSGGDREREVQDQAQSLTTGANTVMRLRKNVTITYGLKLWLPAHFAVWDRWYAMLEEGDKRTPQVRVYDFRDLRRRGVSRVVYQADGALKTLHAGGPWQAVFTLHEYTRQRPYGGAVKPPQNAVEREIAAVSADNKALAGAIDTITKAHKAGK